MPIRNWLNWQGQWKLLKLAFDVATDEPSATHDIPFGWTEGPTNGYEFPTQMWMDVSGPAVSESNQTVGAALLNDGKYGCDVTDSVMRLTVLRSPPYAYHEPHTLGTKRRYDWIDQGFQEFTVAVRPHVGDWQQAGIVERARRLNQPPLLYMSRRASELTKYAANAFLATKITFINEVADLCEKRQTGGIATHDRCNIKPPKGNR